MGITGKAYHSQFTDVVYDEISEQMSNIHKQRESDIKTICHDYLIPPIKGEITKSKLRWRGATSMLFDYEYNFIGIIQRGFIIDAKVNRTKLNGSQPIPRVSE